MSLQEIRLSVKSGGYDKDFELLYRSTNTARFRYLKAVDEFEKLYGDFDSINFFSAPGRTEVGGNHTDHQHGRVLAGSVDLDVIAVVAKNNDNIVRIKSEGYDMDIIDLNQLDAIASEEGKAASLIRGMCAFVKQSGFEIGGFNAYTTSNVLKGSGLSSSAAFEVLVGVILSHLFNNGVIDAVEIAKLAQKAENIYFGKPCGLMDQMASSVGGFTAIDFADPKNPVIEKINFDLAAHNHSLCIINTGGNHADLTSDYAAITEEMRAIANFLGEDFLRDINEDEFFAKISVLREECGDRAVIRAMHFLSDNALVVQEKNALLENRFDDFLLMIKKSGNSSYKYLQNVFSASAPKEQGLSLALALTERFLNEKGGYRVHGGGFAGTIQAFVPNDMLEDYKKVIEDAFGEDTCYVLNIRPVGGYALGVK
ncbi:MAG: galactokinase [Clostridia bacterium]|nr:galactokinase [Clostridia bacterium]